MKVSGTEASGVEEREVGEPTGEYPLVFTRDIAIGAVDAPIEPNRVAGVDGTLIRGEVVAFAKGLAKGLVVKLMTT